VRPPRLPTLVAAAVFVAVCLGPPIALAIHALRHSSDPAVDAAFAELAEPAYRAALGRTLALGAITAALCVVLGVPYAVLLARTNLPGRSLWGFLTFLGLLLPPYFSTVGWMSVLGDVGAITRSLGLAGRETPPIQTDLGVVLVLVGALFPIVPLLTAYALRRLRPELEEAALLETGVLGVLRRATLPAVSTDVAAAGLLVFVLAVGGFAATDLLTGARTFGARMFALFNEFAFRSAAAAVLLLPMVGVAAVVLLAFHALTRRGSAGQDQLGEPTARVFALSPAAATTGFAFVALTWAITVGVPLGTMAARLVPGGAGDVGFAHAAAAAWGVYARAWRQSAEPLSASVIAAAVAGVAAALVGFALAGAIASCAPAARARWATACFLPLVLPSALLGIGLIHLRSETAVGAWLAGDVIIATFGGREYVLRTSWLAVPIAYLGRFLPIAVAIVLAGFRRLDRAVLEAAAVDGATPARAWARVAFPLLRAHAAVAGLTVFALSLGEVDCVRQVIPPRTELIAQTLYEQAHRNLEHNLAGMCLVMLTVIAAAAVAAHLLLSRAERR
jgi:iron(III) transport system permease protein